MCRPRGMRAWLRLWLLPPTGNSLVLPVQGHLGLNKHMDLRIALRKRIHSSVQDRGLLDALYSTVNYLSTWLPAPGQELMSLIVPE